jgi:exodeoxyribonuclease III
LNELKKKKHTILCGDLNVCHHEIDIAKPKGNEKSAGFTKEERAEFTKYLAQGWIDTFRHLYPKEVKYSYFNARSDARK